jgi:hypothetical protein
MTVAELIEKLEQVNPYLVVRVWDTHKQGFTDRFYLQPATYDDELLVTPSQCGARKMPQNEWQTLFEEASSDRSAAQE